MVNNKGLIFALVASISWGLLYNIDQKILLKTSPLTMFLIGGIMQVIILIPYLFTQTGYKDISNILSDKTQLGLLFIAEIIYIIAGLSILYAVKYLTASVASAFEISYPFFVVLFAYIFFNGNISLNYLIGIVLIFVGSLIILIQ